MHRTEKMTKETEPWFLKKGWIYLISVIIVTTFLLFQLYPLDDYYYCENNPEKCVCGELSVESCNTIEANGEVYHVDFENDCHTTFANFNCRRKTLEELEVDYCKDNTNDDERCVCQKRMSAGGSTTKGGEIEFIYNEGKCFVYLYPLDLTLEIPLLGDGGCYADLGTTCSIARPKNECEKDNTDFIEIVRSVAECFDDLNNNGVIDIPEDCIVVNKTFCNRKTEIEKLMDVGCDELLRHLVKYYPFEKFTTTDYKQAWNDKECEV